ncbi:MAG: acyl transferase [Cyclobacteriaceae bacterium]
MNFSTQFKERLLASPPEPFEDMALELFNWQFCENAVYQEYVTYLGVAPPSIRTIEQIPCLPIEFFKYHRIISGAERSTEQIFESSGTTGQLRSKHHVADLSWYHQVCERIFEQKWGPLSDYHIFALLPSYLERDNASLVAMVDDFIRKSQSEFSGFYLRDFPRLVQQVEGAIQTGRKVLLLGVTFALLDLADQHSLTWPEVIVMETGGMKGKRKELIRAEIHEQLMNRLGVKVVAAEYGMTELLSQAYARHSGQFEEAPWMKILIRDMHDPFAYVAPGRQGGINVIDLANVDSCAFIETKDIGKTIGDRSFEVLGRFDNSELRGCNLMI